MGFSFQCRRQSQGSASLHNLPQNLLWVLCLLAFCVSLSTELSAELPAELSTEEVTFNQDVAPIFYERCVLCHRPGDVAPMSLLTWEEARPWAKSIAREVGNRRMPPFHADPGDYAFANDVSLSEEEIKTIQSWVDQGAKQGKTPAPPLPEMESLAARHRLGPPDVVLRAAEGLTLPPGSDLQRAFVLKNPYEEDVWLAAIDYDTRSPVVHHLLAVTDSTGQATTFEQEDPSAGFAVSLAGGQGSDRMMSLYMNGASFLGSWAPGWVARKLGDDIGIRLKHGHDIVLQIHYWNGTDQTVVHQPSVGLYFNKEPVTKLLRSGGPAADPEIFIAAGDRNARHEANWIAPSDLEVYSASPHMHFLGKSMTVSAKFPDGTEKLLLDVPRFQFAWQATYLYEEPILLPKGTRVQMVSIHDNSAENPDNPSDPPQDVTFGERSTDEMAECILSYTYLTERDPNRIVSELDRLPEYLEILREDPKNARLQLQVGRLLMARNREAEALSHLEEAARLAPDYIPSGEALSQALERLGRNEDALKELERLMALAPEAVHLLMDSARLEEKLGQPDKAVTRYQAVTRIPGAERETRGAAHFRIGVLQVEQGSLELALTNFGRAAELSPEVPEMHLNQAILLARAGRFAECASAYGRVLKLDSENQQARFSRVIALLMASDEQEAIRELELARSVASEPGEFTHLLARVLATAPEVGLRDGERALALARQVFETQPSADRAETLAMALAEVGRFTEAIQMQRRLVEGMETAGRLEMLPSAQRCLAAYERGEACRSPWLD